MKTFPLLLAFCLLSLCAKGQGAVCAGSGGDGADYRRLSVLQLNIWQDATQVPGAFQGLAEVIAAQRPDVVTLCEVCDFGGVNFTDSLCRSLQARGERYYTCPSQDAGILSRYPIVESRALDSVSINRALIDVDGCPVAVYSVHLDYTHYACYLPRGYDGVTWQECPYPASAEEILTQNDASRRPGEVRRLVAEAGEDLAAGVPVIIGGDFNEPSWLDWQDDTRNLYDHRGFVVSWTSTRLLHQAGYRDAYRELHPDAVTHPGFTWPASNRDVPVGQLTWAPKSDERDRIDFVFYRSAAKDRLRPVAAFVVGPRASIVRGERVDEASQDSIVEPQGVWPSDHKGVMVCFELACAQQSEPHTTL